MLVQLMYEQVSDQWPLLKHAVANSMPRSQLAHPESLNNVLMALMSGEMQAWVGYRNADEPPYMVVVTRLGKDVVTGRKSVFIHNLYSTRDLTDSEFSEGFMVLSKWGRALGAEHLEAFTNVESLIRQALRRQGEVFGYVSVPLM